MDRLGWYIAVFLLSGLLTSISWARMVDDEYAHFEKESMVCTFKDKAYKMTEIKAGE